ncbi:putative F-box protein At3g10430 [Chenopodium quinoa]|uniref:F-box domain-containing protein n=1 Tax=Chenopodium quinoa TaxID=63459 RepID=A0A803LS13_CHEQI|nr:putative F-box protein At3g10430 [Chenopodium quinoa]XP_021735485.1 putative F-box protein At3g10430 [Chenopodium quinoa]
MALSLQRYTWSDDNSRFNHLLKQRINNEKERSMSIAIERIGHLPENLIIEILSRLPVKDLLQFKSVCKSWHAIISSPNFISKHLNNYYNNDESWRRCILVQYYVTHAELQLYELLLDESHRVLADEVLYSMPMYSSYICGPCHGLYYLYQYDSSGRALWNPAINEFKPLPKIICKPDLPSEFTYASNEVYGFGFDPVSGDYKVVVMKGYWSTNDDDESDVKHPVSVLVYSLRTDSWRYCGDLARAYDLESNKCYIYVNGCCYWFGSLEYSSEVIISFDMATDAFKEIDVPDYAQPSSKCLGVYDDSLAFLTLHETDKKFEIWIWSEECWTKKFTVGPLSDIRSPVGHWRNNRLLLECVDGKLVLLDPETPQEIKDLAFQKERWCEGVFAYMESLVSIKDKNEAGLQPEEVEAENN